MKKMIFTGLIGMFGILLAGCSVALEPAIIDGLVVDVTNELQLVANEFTRFGEVIDGELVVFEVADAALLGIDIPEIPDFDASFTVELVNADLYEGDGTFYFDSITFSSATLPVIEIDKSGVFTFAIRQDSTADAGWILADDDFEFDVVVSHDLEDDKLVATVESFDFEFLNVFTVDITDDLKNIQPTVISVQFVGDVFLHRGPIEAGRTGHNPETFNFNPFLTHIRPYLDADLRIANMETPVDVLGNNRDITTFPMFNAPFEILEALVYAGFDHVNTANNHSFDRHWAGLVATVENVERAGLTQTGMYTTPEERDVPTIMNINGVKVGFISYTDSVNGLESFVSPEQNQFGVRRFRSHVMDDVESMLADEVWLREQGAEVVIMSLHWGAEYVDEPTQMQRNIARALIDGGVDIIMGKHSHTPQPVEWHYREDGTRGFVMYSLGNFLADQTRLVPVDHRTQFGMLTTVEITRMPNGDINLTNADVLPTLTMRDFNGNVLRHRDDITVLPVIEGQLPEGFNDPLFRDWATRAYNHLNRIVGSDFITRRQGSELFE